MWCGVLLTLTYAGPTTWLALNIYLLNEVSNFAEALKKKTKSPGPSLPNKWRIPESFPMLSGATQPDCGPRRD